jgi:hypothetical protein
MKISDIERGEATIVELSLLDNSGFGKPIAALSEVNLYSSEMGNALLLQIDDNTWEVSGTDDHEQNTIERLIARNLPRVAWVATGIPQNSSNPTSIVVEIREFPSQYVWSDTINIGVDEKILDAMRQKRKSLLSINDVVTWLSDSTLVEDQNGNCRAFFSGSPTLQANKRSGFRLYGKGIVVDIARDDDDCLLVTRVVEARRPNNNDERKPVLIIIGHFRFIDYTIVERFRGIAKTQLDQLVEEANSYLSLWREYNQLERQSILRRAREFKWLKYSACRQLTDGKWRFELTDTSDIETNIRMLEDSETIDLEAAQNLPPELYDDSNILSKETNIKNYGRIFTGVCVGFDRNCGSIDLRPPLGRDEDDVSPPERGVIFISLSGDRKRLERRENAQSLIASAECPMPQLGLLIEGKVVPERRRKQEKPLSAGARQAFGGEPTGRQIEALRVALNTPDIALIQGPPGTGKTRTIAALQTRLSEIKEDTDGVAGRSLLTSYQHDAVENVANATQVYGLPAIKIGRKRGQTDDDDGFERWRRDRIEAVSAQLVEAKGTPAIMALRKCRDIAIGYLRAPSHADNVVSLLGEVRKLAVDHIPSSLADKLLELQQALSFGTRSSNNDDQDRDLALKAVRGLRCDSVTFSDDGPMQALKTLQRLDQINILTNNERALIECAADWEGQEPPDFLDEIRNLQQSIIDRLLPDERPINAPLVNTDVEALFGSVIDALRERVRLTDGGVESVLYEYRNDLEHDQKGARDAVKLYTVVLAATCQQADGYHMKQQKGEKIVFETVVIDEAARANPLDLFIPMALAERRIILVGDHRQLPHILELEIERDLDKNVTEKTQDMLRKSLFERLFTAMRKRELEDGIKRTVTLDIQYRMHPVLGDFVSDTFYKPYGEEFKSGRDADEFRHNLQWYGDAVAAWVDIPLVHGRESGRQSKKRKTEAKWIACEVYKILCERPDFSVGVITFYSAQRDELLQHMAVQGLTEQLEDGSFRVADNWRDTRDQSGHLKERLRVGTVDAFQGKEFDVVILSMTRSNNIDATDEKSLYRKYGHLMLENRLCVAMSRQQRLLIVVGDSSMLEPKAAVNAISGLVRFRELCGGKYGAQLHV